MLVHLRRFRNLGRYREIVTILARHGFGSFLEYVQVNRRLSLPASLFKQYPSSHLTLAEHLRLAFEELGPTFIKLGQVLSTRPDLLPPDFITELSKLRDAVPANPWAEVRAMLVEELGKPPEELFDSMSILIAAFVIGLAFVVPLAAGNPVLLVLVAVGFVAVLLLGIWLIISILRSSS